MQTISFPPGADVSLQIMMALSGRPKGERLLTIVLDCYSIGQNQMAADVRNAIRAIGAAVTNRRGMRVNLIQAEQGVIIETDVFARNHLEQSITDDYFIHYSYLSPSLSPVMEELRLGKWKHFFVPRSEDNVHTPVIFIGGAKYMDADLGDPVYKGKELPEDDWPNYIHLCIPHPDNRPRI